MGPSARDANQSACLVCRDARRRGAGDLGRRLCVAVSQEDYAPKPGTLAYYVGMSSLVRHAPVANAAGAPDYFGSVGDGDKAPRSEVSYAVSPGSVDDAYASMDAYLQSRGFQPRPPRPPAWWPRSRTARNWCATPSTCPVPARLVVLAVSRTADPADGYRITLTHWD